MKYLRLLGAITFIFAVLVTPTFAVCTVLNPRDCVRDLGDSAGSTLEDIRRAIEGSVEGTINTFNEPELQALGDLIIGFGTMGFDEPIPAEVTLLVDALDGNIPEAMRNYRQDIWNRYVVDAAAAMGPLIMQGLQAEMHSRARGNPSRRLHPDEMAFFQDHFDGYFNASLLESVVLHFNVRPTTEWTIVGLNIQVPMAVNAGALTIDNHIFVNDGDVCSNQDAYCDNLDWLVTLGHELVHVKQYANLGVNDFGERYASQWATTLDYHTMQIETQARDLEAGILSRARQYWAQNGIGRTGHRYVMVCIVNRLNGDIRFSTRWGNSGWSSTEINSGDTHRYWRRLNKVGATTAPVFEIRYDASFDSGNQSQIQTLRRFGVTNSNSCNNVAYLNYIEAGEANSVVITERQRTSTSPNTTSPTTHNTPIGVLSIGATEQIQVNNAVRRRVTLAANTTYTFTATASNFDTTITLIRESDNQRVGYDDDSGDNTNSILTYTPTSAGSYLVVIDDFNGTPTGSLVITANGTAPTTTTNPTIYPHDMGRSADTTVSDVVRLRVNLNSSISYTFTADSPSFDTTITLIRESDGQQVAFDDDGGNNTNSRLIYTPDVTGSYLFIIDAFSGTPSGELIYNTVVGSATSNNDAPSNTNNSRTINSEANCPGHPPTYVHVGDTVEVSRRQSDSNNVRISPNTTARRVRTSPPGTPMTVIEGPVCAHGYRWWNVMLPSGVAGWMADGDGQDFWIDPLN